MRTFRARILLLLLGLVMVTQVATVLALVMQTNKEAKLRARQELQSGGQVLNALLNSRAQQLGDAVRVLVADYGFKEAVTSRDQATAVSALENVAARIDASTASLIDLDGRSMAATRRGVRMPEAADLQRLLNTQTARDPKAQYLAVDGQAYMLVIAPVRAPMPVAFVMMGFSVNQPFASALSELLKLDVSFYDVQRNGQPSDDATAMHALAAPAVINLPAMQAALAKSDLQLSQPAIVHAGDADYMTLMQPLTDSSSSLKAVLQKPLRDAIAPYVELRTAILLIAALALIMVVPLALLLSRQATKPLDELVTAAQRIESGNYSQAVALQGGGAEFDRVATTLDSMQRHIADREQRIRYQASYDPLTGLPNRILATEWLTAALSDAATRQRQFPLLLLAVKGFEHIKASLGHAIGDSVVSEVARRLSSRAGTADLVAHFGAAQFLLVMTDMSCEVAETFASQLIESVRSGLILDNVPISLDAHVGICLFPEHGPGVNEGPADLLRRLDTAAYDAAERDIPMVVYEKGRNEDHRRQLALLGDLRRAVNHDELTLYYQPKVDMLTHQIHSMEALVRWQHPTLGMVPPNEFIPLAERTGVIVLLTGWVLKAVLKQMQEWRRQGFDPDVSVNLSSVDLLNPKLPDLVLTHLQQSQVPAQKLILEITESAVMKESDRAIRVMQHLRHYGIRFSIDDFGTGYSSLAQFKRLPVDEIKIDKSFVLALAANSDDAVIVQSTIDLGHNLGVKVVAEGVENTDSWRLLLKMGCDYAQGYFISKPLPAQSARRFVEEINGHLEFAHSATQQIHAFRLQSKSRESA
jgi:diguanylate cyclase (GGDEF)-like protein